MSWLLAVQLLGVLDVEAKEIAEFRGSIDLSLPGILALTEHRRRHEVVSVLGAYQVGGLQEYSGTVHEGKGLPRRLCGEGGVDRCLDMFRARLRVGSEDSLTISRVDLRPCRRRS